jgi:hypothetical protein
MNELGVAIALEKTLIGISGVDASAVAKTNVPFTPPSSGVWYRGTILPADRVPWTIGSVGRDRMMGLYQIDIFTKKSEGVGNLNDQASLVLAAFARNTTIDGSIRILRSSISRAVSEESYYMLSVSVEWFRDNAGA